MLYLSIEDNTMNLSLFINSPVVRGIAIYDTIRFVPPNMHIICMRLTASIRSFILIGEVITKRLPFPRATEFLFEKKKTMPSSY